MTDAERYFFRAAVLTYAGPLAQARASRPSREGWVRHLSLEQKRAVHEAGHGIAAAAVGQFVHQLSIVPDPERCFPGGESYSGGFCLSSDREEDDREQPGPLTRDHSAIARAAWLLTPFGNKEACRWKTVRAAVRAIRQTAEKILDTHWLSVLELAGELERRQNMNRNQIERFTQRIRATAMDVYSTGGPDHARPVHG